MSLLIRDRFYIFEEFIDLRSSTKSQSTSEAVNLVREKRHFCIVARK